MKKLPLILSLIILFTALPVNININASGFMSYELGDVLHTDISTYINGYFIPCYIINNRAIIFVKHLYRFGFDTVYNDEKRMTTITYNPDKAILAITTMNLYDAGTVAYRHKSTDIKAYINGKRIKCFNIEGNLAIYFEALKEYGEVKWNSETRKSKFVGYNYLNITEEQIETAVNNCLSQSEYENYSLNKYVDNFYFRVLILLSKEPVPMGDSGVIDDEWPCIAVKKTGEVFQQRADGL